jgi:hypothetical protein
MAIRFAKRSMLTILVLSAAALGITGCELIPGLLSGSPPPPTATFGALTVSVERVGGAIEGEPIDTSLAQATGFHTPSGLQFEVTIPSQDTSLSISTPGTDGSSENPYAGEELSALPRVDGGVELEGGDFEPRPRSREPVIIACSPVAGCRHAEDVGLEIAQLVEGRTVLVEGAWSGGDRVHLEMHYREHR